MANILYRGSAAPTVVNTAGAKNAALTNIEIDQNFYALERDKLDKTLGGTVTANVTFSSAATVQIDGNLIVNGTTTTINSTTLSVDDINVTLGDITSPTDITANGGGITLKGATDKTFNWVSSTAAWTSSEHLALSAGKKLLISGATSGTVTLAVPAAAGTNTITFQAATGTVAHLADIANATITVNTGSGLTGSGTFTTNQTGNGTITLSHGATSTGGGVTNTGGTLLQSITIDSFGHITASSSLDGDARWINTSGDTMTGRLVITSGASGGIAFPDNAFGGTGDTASITLQNPAGGEAQRMTFTLTNDVDDLFSFIAPSNNGMLMNGNVVWNSGNDGSGSGLDADLIDGLDVHTGRNNEVNKIVRTDASGYLQVGYINSTSGDENNASSPGRIWGTNGSDAYLRTYRTANTSVGYAAEAANNTFFVRGTAPQIQFVDTDQGQSRYVHHNGGSIGFLNSAGSWVLRCDDTTTYGTFSGDISGNATYSSNARYVYDNGAYSGTAAYREASAMYVAYAANAGSASSASTAGQVTINYNNNSNSTYQMLWGSGNSVYGTAEIYCNPSTDYLYAKSFSCADWHRSTGATGWYNETYAVGIYASDAGNVRTYNGANFICAGLTASSVYSSGDVTAYSDAKLKTNVTTIENALDLVSEMRGVRYERLDLNNQKGIGVIAQEMQNVLPEVVSRSEENDTLGVAYGNIVGVLIEAIKELNAKVVDLQNQLAAK